jgi:hypothetical protein
MRSSSTEEARRAPCCSCGGRIYLMRTNEPSPAASLRSRRVRSRAYCASSQRRLASGG